MSATKVTKWARTNRSNSLIRHAVSHRDLDKHDQRREVTIAYCGSVLYTGAVWVEGEDGPNSDLQTLTPCKRCTKALDRAAAEIAAETAVHANTPGAVATPLCGKWYGAVPADGREVNCPNCIAALSAPQDDAPSKPTPASQYPIRCGTCNDPLITDGTLHVWSGRQGLPERPYDHPAVAA